MRLKRVAVSVLCICVSFGCAIASASDLVNVSVSRIIQQDQTIYVYADVYDSTDNNAQIIPPGSDVTATIDGHSVPITNRQTIDTAGYGVHYVIVVDVSRTGNDSWSKAREGIKALVHGINSTDHVSLIVSSHNKAEIRCTAENNVQTVVSALDGVRAPNSNGNGRFYDALKLSIDVANQSVDNPLMRRVIIAYANVRVADNSTITVDEIGSGLEGNEVPLYLISYGENNRNLQTLSQAARSSGGAFFRTSDYRSIPDLIASAQRRAKGSYLFELNVLEMPVGIIGQARVTIGLNSIDASKDARVNIVTPTPTESPTPEPAPEITASPTPIPPDTPPPTPFATLPVQLADTVPPTESETDKSSVLIFTVLAVIIILLVIMLVFVLRKRSVKSLATPIHVLPGNMNETIISTNHGLTIRTDNTFEDIGKTLSMHSVNQETDDPLAKTMTVEEVLSKGVAATFEISVYDRPNGKVVDSKTCQLFVLDEFTIGRQKDCSICVNNPTVNRKHAMMMSSLGKILIRDMGGTNKTLVNGAEATEPRELQSGDIVELGLVKIKVMY